MQSWGREGGSTPRSTQLELIDAPQASRGCRQLMNQTLILEFLLLLIMAMIRQSLNRQMGQRVKYCLFLEVVQTFNVF